MAPIAGRTAAFASPRLDRRAFTLIELLMVITIIALLASMLVPSLSRAAEMARIASCASKLRNIGFAWQFYLQDNNKTFPVYYFNSHWGYGGKHPVPFPTEINYRPLNPYMQLPMRNAAKA